jgi:hypothetical protein
MRILTTIIIYIYPKEMKKVLKMEMILKININIRNRLNKSYLSMRNHLLKEKVII